MQEKSGLYAEGARLRGVEGCILMAMGFFIQAAGGGGVCEGEVRVVDAGESWEAWVGRYAGAALLYARQWVPGRADAEDVVQEGFLRFWRARGRARGPGVLFAAVRTAALDFRRGELRRKRREGAVTEGRGWFAESGDGRGWWRWGVRTGRSALVGGSGRWRGLWG